MNIELKTAFETQIAAAKQDIRAGRLKHGMRHLEIAHVLGQYHILPHVYTHWLMLRIAVKHRLLADVCGQSMRIVLGALGSAVGIVPSGNTGGCNVHMLKPMPIDPEIAAVIQRDRAAK